MEGPYLTLSEIGVKGEHGDTPFGEESRVERGGYYKEFTEYAENKEAVLNRTQMPLVKIDSREEMDAFYGAFFKKAASLLNDEGKIIMYTNEAGFVKKQLRLQSNYRLVQEFSIRKKEQFFLYIIEKR